MTVGGEPAGGADRFVVQQRGDDDEVLLVGQFPTAAVHVGHAARSLSRHREFVADRDGARLAGDPAAMASALAALDERRVRPATDKRAATRGLCLLPNGFEATSNAADAVTVETRSHPPVEERIARLKSLAAEFEQAA